MHRKRINLGDLVKICSTNPAKRLEIYPRKGIIKLGSDADFVLVDPKTEWKLKNDYLFTKCAWTPFEGMVLRGKPVSTILRGNIIDYDCTGKNLGRFAYEN